MPASSSSSCRSHCAESAPCAWPALSSSPQYRYTSARGVAASAVTASSTRACIEVAPRNWLPLSAARVMGESAKRGRLTVVQGTDSESFSKMVGQGCHCKGSTPASQFPSRFTTLSWRGSSTSYPTMPWLPGTAPVPSDVSEVAVVLGNAACNVRGCAPAVSSAMTPRKNGACPDFSFSSAFPKPSTSTTQIRVAAGSFSTFSKDPPPNTAAALLSTSPMLALP